MEILAKQTAKRTCSYFAKFIVLVLFSCSAMTYGQQKNKIISIQQIGNLKATSKAFKSYTGQILPAAYFENGVLKKSDNEPITLFSDVSSMNKLASFDKQLSVEYVAIRIKKPSDLGKGIDLTVLEGYKNLKFIHLIFEFDIVFDDAVDSIKNPINNVTIVVEPRIIM